jgi:hypothetical protein
MQNFEDGLIFTHYLPEIIIKNCDYCENLLLLFAYKESALHLAFFLFEKNGKITKAYGVINY